MTRLFWYFMLGVSGVTVGIALIDFVTGSATEITFFILILGLVLTVISFWGARKFAGIGVFSGKQEQ